MFEAAATNGTMRDPQEIASAMVRLVEGPREERPLRASVDVMFGQSVVAINEVCAQAQAGMMAALTSGKT